MRIWFNKRRVGWLIIAALVLTIGVLISLLVIGSTKRDFTATSYADVIRFEAEGVATLQVRIFDLSGKEVWDSGVVSSWVVDWDRRNEFGERLAYGAYIYSAQGWNASGDVIFQKNGKLALLPGDKVQLQAAPAVASSGVGINPANTEDKPLIPLAVDVNHSTETWAFGKILVGTTDDTGTAGLKVNTPVSAGWDSQFHVADGTTGGYFAVSEGATGSSVYVPVFTFRSVALDGLAGGFAGELSSARDVLNENRAAIVIQGQKRDPGDSYPSALSNANLFMVRNYATPYLTINVSGKVGIGTTTPTATLEVHGSATNLLALYDPSGNDKFRVEKDGDVRADGAYYGSSYNTGAADVAERINTSEWVEAGYVVEIDPEHPGFFRKSSSPYSRKVAGIISTSPGVVLGNDFKDSWEDNRPVLAIAGRVSLQVTAENGPIQIGDLLVSSSTPGVGMKGSDQRACVGTVIGKAMEPLQEGTGTIIVQVMLR